MRWVFVGIVVLNVLYFGWKFTADQMKPAREVAVEAEPVAWPAGLQLVGEASPSALAPAQAAVPSLPAGCPAVGPFSDEEDAGRTVDALDGAGLAATARALQLKDAPVFWVYLPPFATRQAAMQRLRELHAKGIDSFVVGEGADANAISLGTFTSRDSALGVQSRMRTAGYGVEIREQVKDVRQLWVVLDDPAATGFLEFVPADLRAAARAERLPCR